MRENEKSFFSDPPPPHMFFGKCNVVLHSSWKIEVLSRLSHLEEKKEKRAKIRSGLMPRDLLRENRPFCGSMVFPFLFFINSKKSFGDREKKSASPAAKIHLVKRTFPPSPFLLRRLEN